MSDIHDASAAYALDALDEAELAEFGEHLAGCADCRREVAELQEAASGLALSAPVPPPPPSLRASVLAGITGVAQLPPLADDGAGEDVDEHGSTAADVVDLGSVRTLRADPSDDVTQVAAVDELALRRASRRARVLSVLVAAVTVVALALGGTVWGLVRQQEPPVAGPAPSVTAPQVDPSLLAAPDVRIYRTRVQGVPVSFVVSKRQNRAVFVSAGLPSAGSGNVWHLWTLNDGDEARPDNVFSASGQVTEAFSGPVDESAKLAINIEPAGTSPQAPTNDPLAVQKI